MSDESMTNPAAVLGIGHPNIILEVDRAEEALQEDKDTKEKYPATAARIETKIPARTKADALALVAALSASPIDKRALKILLNAMIDKLDPKSSGDRANDSPGKKKARKIVDAGLDDVT